MASEAAIAVNNINNNGGELGMASPKNKVKFLCSHGGKILHRPIDGQLKYVGGETRVVAVNRDVGFSELMRKLAELFPGDMVLKYQILPEDLDALVSVKSDEDLKYLIDEYDRLEHIGTSKLRTFLFPAKPIEVEGNLALVDAHTQEQRYIDAINGIVRTTTRRRRPSITANSISSVCPSPKSISPDGHSVDSVAHDAMLANAYQNHIPVAQEPAAPNGLRSNRLSMSMSRVKSSPSLCNLGNTQSLQSSNSHSYTQNNNSSSSSNPHIHQQHPHNNTSPNHHQQHYHHGPGYQFPPVRLPQDSVRLPQDSHKSNGLPPLMVPVVSMDRPEMSRFYVSQGSSNYYYPPSSSSQKWYGSSGGSKYYDDGSYSVTPEVRSRAQSPRLEWSPKGVE